MKLKDRVAIITGGGGGVGRASALLFAREGATVVVADIDGDRAREVADEIRAAGGAAAEYRVDVARAGDVEQMIAFTEDRFGRVDVLFNNAGIFDDADVSVVDTEEDVWDRVMSVNAKGVFFGCKFGIPALLRTGGGTIVNTSSLVALMGAAVSQCAYTASKGAVLSLTREIAVEFARRGIRANALCPGPLDTPLVANLFRDERARNRRLVHIPMGRLGRSDEIARAALFLACDDSSFMTGAQLVVDGGITAAYVTPE